MRRKHIQLWITFLQCKINSYLAAYKIYAYQENTTKLSNKIAKSLTDYLSEKFDTRNLQKYYIFYYTQKNICV